MIRPAQVKENAKYNQAMVKLQKSKHLYSPDKLEPDDYYRFQVQGGWLSRGIRNGITAISAAERMLVKLKKYKPYT